jgi:hypothetical protein
LPEFYEIDFLPVHRSDSGDAIALRYQIGEYWYVHVVDGGFTSTAPDLAAHIRTNYGTSRINRMVVTHPDQDHAEGLAPILDNFDVEELWMLRPWLYADYLLEHFSRYNDAGRLRARLRDDYPYIAELERIAIRKGIPIYTPFQGKQIGAFTVLAPSPARYLQLVIESEKTPQRSVRSKGIFDAIMGTTRPVAQFIKAGWGSERFSPEPTSVENEMSVVQYARLCGHQILLTGDAGRDGMTEAADFAPYAGLFLPGIDMFQVPHHGGRRNVSTEILDRWLGPRLPRMIPPGQERFTAVISSAKEDPEHPRKAVLRALMHRGAQIATTEEGAFWRQVNAPSRGYGWDPIEQPWYPNEQEN